MGLRKGDMIMAENGVEGIIVELKKGKYQPYYHKATIFCTLDPILGEVGTLLHINLSHCRKMARSTEQDVPHGT